MILIKLLGFILPLLATNMRAPGNGFKGWLAMKLMQRINQRSIETGIQRLQLQPEDTFVELGAGHGVGIRKAHAAKPNRIVGVEISEAFRSKLNKVKQDLEKQGTKTDEQHQQCTLIEIYAQDAKDMSFFLEDNSVDKMFGMNVVYFLDPLGEYLKEIQRVLKPGGVIVFGGKFGAMEDSDIRPPFINTKLEPILEAMKAAGFKVSATFIDLGDKPVSYTEIKGVKPATDV
jgi:SAM-dependent methyltransferase